METHEPVRHETQHEGSSDRSFGRTMGVAFSLLALLFLRKHRAFWPAPLPIAAAFFIAAETCAHVLAPLNRSWTRLSFALQKITNPIVMGVLFYVIVTPAALLLRLFGKDPLKIKPAPGSASYWIRREEGLPASESMRHQF